MNAQTIKARINRELSKLTADYLPEIPLGEIIKVVEKHAGEGTVVQEDGTRWSGMLCGSEGTARIKINGFRFYLVVQWFTMPSGKYEVVSYAS